MYVVDMSFYVVFYKVNDKDWSKTINTNLKPSVGEKVKIDNQIYEVKRVCTDYDEKGVHVFVE